MKLWVVATLPPSEAALLAGRLEAEGVRAMVVTGHSTPGPNIPSPLPETADVLIDERDREKARLIAAQYLDP